MLSMLDDPGAHSTGTSAKQEMLINFGEKVADINAKIFNLEKEVADINAQIKVSFSYITCK